MSGEGVEFVRWQPDPSIVPEVAVLQHPRSGAEAMAKMNNNNNPGRKSTTPNKQKSSGSLTPRGGGNNNNNASATAASLGFGNSRGADRNKREATRGTAVTPVQVLIQVQESLEHACATADQHDAPELSGPEIQADYTPVEGTAPGIPKFRTFLEQEENRSLRSGLSVPRSNHHQLYGSSPSVGGYSASVSPARAGAAGGVGVPPISGLSAQQQQLHHGAPSEIDDSISQHHLEGEVNNNNNNNQHEVQSGGDQTPRGKTPRKGGGEGESGYPVRVMTPRSTVYVTNAVTARFISERLEASVRDSLVQQEYQHRLDLMRAMYVENAQIAARENKNQLREALDQQYLARAEVEELRGAIALRLSDIEEVARVRLEHLADDTRGSQERELNRLYGIVTAGQQAAQQQWQLGCEERERHFITSECDRIWSRISGSFLSEQHSLQLKGMLRERIPVATSRVVNDALDTVHEAPQAIRPIMPLPAQTTSAQILVKHPNEKTSNSSTPNSSRHQQPQQPEHQQQQQWNSMRQAPKPQQQQQQQQQYNNNNNDNDDLEDVAPIIPVMNQKPRPKPQARTPKSNRRESPKLSTGGEEKSNSSKTLMLQQKKQQQKPSSSSSRNEVEVIESNSTQPPTTPKSQKKVALGASQRHTPAKTSKTKQQQQQQKSSATAASEIEMGEVGEEEVKRGPLVPSKKRQQPRGTPTAKARSSLLDDPVPIPATPRPSGVHPSEVALSSESIADRKKRARQAANERSKEARVSPQRNSSAGRGGERESTSGSALIERPLPNVFHPYWGWAFRSLGALLTWQRRFFLLTSNGRLRCANSEKGPWVLVTTADRILRVEVDSYHDVSGNGLAPPTTQYHQYGFYLDVIDGDPADPASARQKRLRFCCYSRAELSNWMHILRRATETIGQLSELGVPGAISPLRRRFDELADEATRLGGPHMQEQIRHITSHGNGGGDNAPPTEENEKLNDWLSQHQDPEGNPITAPPVVPYRARVQLEDEVALLEEREKSKSEKARSEHGTAEMDPVLKHPLAHYNTETSLGRPKLPHEIDFS